MFPSLPWCEGIIPPEVGKIVTRIIFFNKKIEKHQPSVRPNEWLKLNFAICVVHQARSLDVLEYYSKWEKNEYTRIYNTYFCPLTGRGAGS